jgi:hypothetical protein
MKKIALICMALVVALGGLGVGYAMWKDEVTINGSVTTGSVNLDIESISHTYVYKVVQDIDMEEPFDDPEYVVGDMLCSPTAMELDQDGDGTDNLLPVASAVTTNDTTNDDEAVTMTFTNVFPTDAVECPIIADVVVHYTGSIPAHVALAPLTWTSGAGLSNLNAYLTFKWTYWKNIGTPANPAYGAPQVDVDPATLQLHASDLLKLDVIVDGDALQSAGMAAQGLSGEFSTKLTAHQWNEDLP